MQEHDNYEEDEDEEGQELTYGEEMMGGQPLEEMDGSNNDNEEGG